MRAGVVTGFGQPGALERGERAGAHPAQQPGVGGSHQRVGTVVPLGLGLPLGLPRRERGRVLQFRAVQGVVVDVHHDRVAVSDEGDRAAEGSLG